MITYSNDETYLIFCLSTDKKPKLPKASNGAKLLEIDTGTAYFYNATSKAWVEDKTSGGGSGGKSYSAGEGIKIDDTTISVDTDKIATTESVDGVKAIADEAKTTAESKQAEIEDLDEIRSGAALGATALQSYTETDPTVPDYVKSITEDNIASWADKYTKTEIDAKIGVQHQDQSGLIQMSKPVTEAKCNALPSGTI